MLQPPLGQLLLETCRKQEAAFGVAQFGGAQGFEQQRSALIRKHLVPYAARNFKDVLRQCDTHGIDHRTTMNQTPLMAAAAAGNSALVEALLERGADRESTDQYGCNALHMALREAFRDPQFARGPCAALYELLAPAHVDVKAGERLVRIDGLLDAEGDEVVLDPLPELVRLVVTEQRAAVDHQPVRIGELGTPVDEVIGVAHAIRKIG